MILVDSSVWIDTLRGRATRQTHLFRAFAAADEALAIADLCLFEVLQGLKPESALNKTYERLREFAILPVGGEYFAVAAAKNSQFLRARGFQVTPVDCLLATYCIVNGLRLLTSDKDFEPFAIHLGLDLIR